MIPIELMDKLRQELKPPSEIETGFIELVDEYQTKDIDTNKISEYLAEMHTRIGPFLYRELPQRQTEQIYFRARIDDGFDKTDPDKFSHPPEGTGSLGRCNLPGQPVFYGSEALPIAVSEIKCPVGQPVFVSLWRSRENYPTYGSIPLISPSMTARFNEYSKHQEQEFKQMLQMFPVNLRESLRMIRTIQQKMFRDDNCHKLSSIISNNWFETKNIDGIEYPDANTGRCYNFALNPSYAAKLQIHRIYLISTFEGGGFEYLEFGSPNNGKIVWRKPTCPDDPLKLGNDEEFKTIFSDITSNDWIAPTAGSDA